jgi:riboflavin synthase
MFTGIVEAVGEVLELEPIDGGAHLRVRCPEGFTGPLAPGASIAVDGACLTAVTLDRDAIHFDLVASTLERTVAGRYARGHAVNLERALIAGSRLDGHLVQGHVDGVGHLEQIRDVGGTRFLNFRIPRKIQAATILHGSITLNGVSLTVNALDDPERIEVAIIPHTWEHTNLGRLETGDPVNVEGDLIGKYVGRLLGHTDTRNN